MPSKVVNTILTLTDKFTPKLKGTAEEVKKMKRELGLATNQINKFGRNASKQFTDLSKKTLKWGAATVAVLGGAAVKSAADFEQEMTNLKAVSGVTGKEFTNLQNLALKMGMKTKYSATEAALGMTELVKAGVSTKEIFNGGLEGTLSLAAAGDIEIGDAAIIASTALNAFRKDAMSVSRAADILAGAANASASDVEDMSLGLSQASAVASGVGMSFYDTSTALGLFANNGLKGSDAGTSLKTMLLRLQPQTKQQIEAFDELGLSTKNGSSKFYDQKGHVKNLADISSILQDKLKGMTDAQRLATLQVMFGTDAIRAANILYKEGGKGVHDLQKEMSKFTAAQVAAEKMKTFNNGITKLKNNLQTVGIRIGLLALPTLTKWIQTAIVKVNQFAISFMTWSKTAKAKDLGDFLKNTLSVAFTVLAGAIKFVINHYRLLVPVLTAVVVAITAFRVLTPVIKLYKRWKEITQGVAIAQGALNLVISANPIGVVCIAIGLLIAAGVALWMNWDKIRKFMGKLWADIKAIFVGSINAVITVIDWFIQKLNMIPGVKIPLIVKIGVKDISVPTATKAQIEAQKHAGVGGSQGIGGRYGQFALGGFTNKPSIFGESGDEVAIPLNNSTRSKQLLGQTNKIMGSSGGGVHVHMDGGVVIREDADIWRIARALAFELKKAGLNDGGIS